ncbi:hypothetical protein BC936DRAFT_137722 [Jimgerdemannia flammicorona]|uniref:Small ribosomal subunit protein mS29 n=1 Tax=Jimgerdemannia flammicorona TaxID=994334 RepID=A0A433DIS6_9FUNG|nr:hypothetical protein BC936DRAFT_137722 [Jimgerdemannia flammicorona]
MPPKRKNVANGPKQTGPSKRRNIARTHSFRLLEDHDVTDTTSEHVNRIFLLDSSAVPEGGPTGIDFDTMEKRNYPKLDASRLDKHKLPFLIRNCAIECLNLMQSLKEDFDEIKEESPDKKGRISNVGRILTGIADGGKSYALYHVVQFCRASGWLVLYVPRLGTLAVEKDEDAAKKILTDFIKAEKTKLKKMKYPNKDYSVYDFILNGIGNEEFVKTFNGLMSVFLADELTYPLLIAVDEWNARFSQTTSCKEVLKAFNDKMMTSGFWLYSISAAFDPVQGLRNADATTILIKIPSYTEEEYDCTIECQQHFKRLPTAIDKEQIQYHSALIPRMILYWCIEWSSNLERPFEDVLKSFSNRAVNYYRGRIRRTLERASGLPVDNKTLIHQTAAFFYLNVPVTDLPELWEISGLFIEEKSEMDGGAYVYKCVCPSVDMAIVKYFQDSANSTITILIADPAINWRGLELLVSRYFRRGGISTVSLVDKNLMGEKRQDERLNISLSRSLEQTTLLINTPIPPGTFLILRRGHAVIDFIAYSSENLGELFFIQISKSSYTTHESKVTDLKNKIQGGNKSILEHYMGLCQTEDGKKRFPKVQAKDINNLSKKLPKGVYYMFITTSDSEIRSTNTIKNHPVILVQGDDVKSVVGSDWDSYKEKF